MTNRASLPRLAFAFALSGALTGCFNVFDPLDSPTNDAQYESAAKACFDNGDFQCAQQNYNNLSRAFADVKTSGAAFVQLDASGAGMAAFMNAFGSLNVQAGTALTRLASALSGQLTGNNRTLIYNAYLAAGAPGAASSPIQDANLRGLVRFVSAAAFAAELFAEDAGTPGLYQVTDLVADPAGCAAAFPTAASCTGATLGGPCDAPAKSIITAPGPVSGTNYIAGFTTGQALGTPGISMIVAAINDTVFAVNNELGGKGRISSNVVTLLDLIQSLGVLNQANFRCLLLNQSVGTN